MRFVNKLVPDEILDSVLEVSWDWLNQRGLEALILDLDNTLVPYGRSAANPIVLAHIRQLLERGVRAVILSNAGPRRARAVASEMGIPFVANAGKPGLRGYERALAAVSSTPKQTVAVGDQLFRDVLGARSAGCFAVLVPPMSPRDFPGTKLLRLLERLLLAYLARRGAIRPSSLAPWFGLSPTRDRT